MRDGLTMMTDIWGTTPLASTLSWKTSASKRTKFENVRWHICNTRHFICTFNLHKKGPDSDCLQVLNHSHPARLSIPSWILAPPESFKPMTGAPTRTAMSIIFTIFCAWVSERDPPNTVKSWENANTFRPFTVPYTYTYRQTNIDNSIEFVSPLVHVVTIKPNRQ